MELIDVSEYQSTDSPELAAFKMKVVEVANKYTKANGWCSEVKRALKEMGIEERPIFKINVFYTVLETELAKRIAVDAAELANMDLNGQIAVMASKIEPVEVRVGGKPINHVVVEADHVTRFVVVDKPLAPSGTESDWSYVSNCGRVLHRFRDGDYFTVCGQVSFSSDRTKNSPRGEGRRCERCANSL